MKPKAENKSLSHENVGLPLLSVDYCPFFTWYLLSEPPSTEDNSQQQMRWPASAGYSSSCTPAWLHDSSKAASSAKLVWSNTSGTKIYCYGQPGTSEILCQKPLWLFYLHTDVLHQGLTHKHQLCGISNQNLLMPALLEVWKRGTILPWTDRRNKDAHG